MKGIKLAICEDCLRVIGCYTEETVTACADCKNAEYCRLEKWIMEHEIYAQLSVEYFSDCKCHKG